MLGKLSVRARLLLLVVVTAGLYVVAVGSMLWEMEVRQHRFLHFVDTELGRERHLSEAYAQGLQMGQALRNILLDPANPKAYTNYENAQQAFNQALAAAGKGGGPADAELSAAVERWAPVRARLVALVRANDAGSAREMLVKEETPAWRAAKALLLEELALARKAAANARTELQESYQASRMQVLLESGIGLLLCLLATSAVSRQLFRQLGGEPAVAVEVAQRIAAGELRTAVPAAGAAPDSLIATMGCMQSQLSGEIGEIRSAADSLSSAIDGLRANAERVAQGSHTQSETAASIAAAMEEMSASIAQVSEHSIEAERLAGEAETEVGGSLQAVSAAADTIGQIAERMHASTEVMGELGRNAEGITRIIKVIEEIAEQTNLLALNAAIEAARAGEQGRGFAVVADEVRKLAERTALSTQEITDMIAKVQASSREAVQCMDAGSALAVTGVERVQGACSAVSVLQSDNAKVREAVGAIELALLEQRTASAEISRGIEHIALMTEQNHVATNDASAGIGELQRLAVALERSVQRFKI
ncbi:MAG: methyl-accepting chemotaxis protein [Zoogloea sp.]|nr:methyl-accepting chemotaxis protein [Zoogloea sp.]